MPRATGLVADLTQHFGDRVETELIKGNRGIFDVVVGEKLVFSKHQEGRFPESDEIIRALEGLG